MALAKEKLVDMYRTMVRIRRFEERVAREFADGNIPGSVHSYIGEEAVPQVSLSFQPVGAFAPGLIVETAPGEPHKSAPPPDTIEEVLPPRENFPFLWDWLRLF